MSMDAVVRPLPVFVCLITEPPSYVCQNAYSKDVSTPNVKTISVFVKSSPLAVFKAYGSSSSLTSSQPRVLKMLQNSTTAKCRHKILTIEAQHNILAPESLLSEALPFENKPVTDRSILCLKDYETDKTSKRNFYLITNDIPDAHVGEIPNVNKGDKKTESTLSSSEKQESVKLDTVRSGESLIKHFNFDTSKYNGDTNKCVAFWRTLMQTNLQPAKCTLLKGGRSSITSNKEEDESSDYDDSCMWYKALVELQRRKMDETAFAATSQQCKLCDREEPYSKFKKRQGQKYSESELKDYEDITCLNYWNPKEKQKVVNESTKQKVVNELNKQKVVNEPAQMQHTNLEELPSTTLKQLEYPPLPIEEDEHSINEDNNITCDDELSSMEENVATTEECEIKLSDSDHCKCGRIHCVCNDYGILSHEEREINMSGCLDLCKCGRIHCLCNDYGIPSYEEEIVVSPQFERPVQNLTSTTSAIKEEKGISQLISKSTKGKTDREHEKNDKEKLSCEKLPKGILQKCEICKTYCNCWEHKIEMSKQFIDESRYQLAYRELKQDKSCETENEEKREEKSEEPKRFCIICGHNDCNCNGPQHKPPRKFFQSIQFQDNMVISLFATKKAESLARVKSLTKSEQISKSAFQLKIHEHSKLDVCCAEQRHEIPDNSTKQDEIKMANKPAPKKLLQKKILVTPEQRAKEIINRNRVILEPDKYGIPQVVRYADGRLAPKPTTSQDILSTDSSEHCKTIKD